LGTWLKCEAEVSKGSHPLAVKLSETLRAREKLLFENDSFLAAIYLDPRYRTIITTENVSRAKLHIGKTLIGIQYVSLGSTEVSNEEDKTQSQEDDDVDILIKSRERNANVQLDLDCQSNSKLLAEFDNYEKLARLDKKLNILEFWNRQRFIFPILYEVSLIVLAVPTTQVSVERSFSGVKFLLSPQRCQLHSEFLEDIVLIRCNSIFDL
jgi:hAT family C-terminal dimerisation region